MDIDRKKFDDALAELFAALDKPFNQVKADAFWRGLQSMSFAGFCRARDQILRELAEGEAPRSFGVHHVWAAYKRLRAAAPAPPSEDQWFGDAWDERANRELLAYIRSRAAAGVHYCSAAEHSPSSVWRGPGWKPDRETRELTAPLIAFKNAWARDCREASPPPTAAKQREWWAECMKRAEAQVNEVRAKYAQGAAA